MRGGLISCILFFLVVTANAQVGGSHTYQFLNLPNAARVAALGGKMLAVKDNDLNLSYHNPALLNASMDQQMVLNFVGYFSGIKYGYLSYSRSVEELGNFAAGVHYVNYGRFQEANADGTITGEFGASEYAFNLIYSKTIDSLFTIGINLKPIVSVFERYTSFGLAADIGASYHSEEGLFSAAVVARNIGSQIKTYHSGEFEPIPFEILASISQKMRYAPFRIHLIFHHLEKFDLSYDLPQTNNSFFDPSDDNAGSRKLENFADNVLRHFIAGVEFTPIENLYLRLGYNYQRRQELKINTRAGTAGFSWGFGVRISKFHISYGRATYHLAGASNHFSVSTHLDDFYRKAH